MNYYFSHILCPVLRWHMLLKILTLLFVHEVAKTQKSIKVEHDSNVNKSLPISSDKFKTQFSDSRRTILFKKLPAHKGTIQKWMFQDGENRNMNSRGIQKMKKHALSKIGKNKLHYWIFPKSRDIHFWPAPRQRGKSQTDFVPK